MTLRSLVRRLGGVLAAFPRSAFVAVIVVSILAAGCATPPEVPVAGGSPSTVESRVTDYLDRYFAVFPSRATAAGLRDRDRQLEDLAPETREEWLRYNEEIVAELDRLLADAGAELARADRLDAELLRREAARVVFDWGTLGAPEHEPLMWSGMLANANVFLLVREGVPAPERLGAAATRARAFPRLVEQAIAALSAGDPARIAPEHVAIASRQAAALATFYRDGFPRAAEGPAPELVEELDAAGEIAATALDELAAFLAELEPRASGSPRLGAERYAELFRLVNGIDTPVDQVLADAEAALVEKRREVAEYGRSVWDGIFPGVEPPAEDVEVVRVLFARVADDHAETVEEFVQDYKTLLQEVEAFARERDLITLPDPLTVTTDRSPEFFTGQGVGGVYPAGPYDPEAQTLFYLPTPSESMTPEQREAFFRDFNHHFNVMITPHEMIPGHYLQAKVAARHPRKARSLFSDGVYTEGWGTFCERLMLDQGWGEPLDRLAHLKKQLENIARTIVDIRVHTQGMTRDEVLVFVQEEALQEAHFASNMWSRAITSAPQITSYWLGYRQHMELFEDVKAARGESFVLEDYLDAMVAEGGIPVAAYREILLGDD